MGEIVSSLTGALQVLQVGVTDLRHPRVVPDDLRVGHPQRSRDLSVVDLPEMGGVVLGDGLDVVSENLQNGGLKSAK